MITGLGFHALGNPPEVPGASHARMSYSVEAIGTGIRICVKAKTCPNCGKRKPTTGRRKEKSKGSPWLVAGGLVVIAAAVLFDQSDGDSGGSNSEGPGRTAGPPSDAAPLTASPVDDVDGDLAAAPSRGPSASVASGAMTEESAKAKAARVMTQSGRQLFGNGFGSGIAAEAGGRWYFRVRARDDAYLVVVWDEGAAIKTCRQARAEGLGCDEEAKWLADAASTFGSPRPATAPTGDCHMEAMSWAKASRATVADVLDRMAVGNNHHLASATACANDGCLLEKLSNACTSYCEAVGVFAALVDDDEAQDRYGKVYGRYANLSVHFDSAKIQAQAGAWDNVPYFLDLARDAVGELEEAAQTVRHGQRRAT